MTRGYGGAMKQTTGAGSTMDSFSALQTPQTWSPPRDAVELRSNGGSPLVNYEEAGRASGLEFAKLEVHR